MKYLVLASVIVATYASFNPCDVCTTVVSIAQQYAPEGEAVVKEKLDDLCQALGTYRSYCQQVVDKQLQNILNHIEDPSVSGLCTKLHLCTTRTNVQAQPKAKPMCEICEFVVNFAKQFADEEEPTLKARLDKLCQALPIIAADCQQVVDKYLAKIMTYLDSQLNAAQICTEISLC